VVVVVASEVEGVEETMEVATATPPRHLRPITTTTTTATPNQDAKFVIALTTLH
jgi:hypothetical protein